MRTSAAPAWSGAAGAQLKLRIVSAGVMMPASLAFVAAGGWPLAALDLALAAIMAWELARRLEPGSLAGLGMMSAAILAPIAVAAFGHVAAATGLAVLGGALVVLVRRIRRSSHAVLSGLGAFYIAAAGISLLALRAWAEAGAWFVAWLFVMTWTADIAAFLGGSSFGRHPLVRAVSPEKTWEGLAFAVLACAAMGPVFAAKLPPFSALSLASLSAGLAVVAELGDLIESAAKRRLGVKDMSRLIPGHGGLLDRLDSLLLVLIVGAISLRVWSQ